MKINCLRAYYISWTKMQIFYTRVALTFQTHVHCMFLQLSFFRNVNRSLCMYKETFYGLIMVPFSFYGKKIWNLKIYFVSKVVLGFPDLLNCGGAIIISYTTKTDLSRGCQKRIRKMSSKMKNQEWFDFITEYYQIFQITLKL